MSAIVPAYMETTQPPQSSKARGLRLYLAGFILVPLLALGFAAWATTQPWFLDHDNYDFGRVAGYSLRVSGLGCEILIYGDSTAMAGLDPKLIQAKTGLKTCNIAEIRPVQNMVGVDFPLDQYLAQNPRPKYLVTAWTPSTFNFDHPRLLLPHQDGYLYAFQHDRGWWLWKGAITHLSSYLPFLNWALNSMLSDALKTIAGRSVRQVRPDLQAVRDKNLGMFTFTNIPEKQCSKPDDPPPTTWDDNLRAVNAFRNRYEARGMRVIVDVTPIADCVPQLDELRKLTVGIVDNKFSVLPVHLFDVDNTHLVRLGAERFSEEVAAQILATMQTKGDRQKDQARRRESNPPR